LTPEVETAASIPPEVPDAAILVDPAVSSTDGVFDSITEQIVQIPALQFGDLGELGLASPFTPAGWVRKSLEIINVSTGMPWFWTIIVGTVMWRLLMIPITVKTSQAGMKIRAAGPDIAIAKAEVDRVSAAGEGPAAKIQAVQGLQEVYRKHGVNPLAGLWGVTLFPLQLGLFFGIKKLCDYPVIQLTQSGFPWYPDLTATDPYYVLPVLSALLLQYSIKVWLLTFVYFALLI
jgi:YidC/Oxa1 family membrane protein insertase